MFKDKAAYVVNPGLGAYYRNEAKDTLQQCNFVVALFDESLNKVVQKGQMDFHIRFIDNKTNLVATKYITAQCSWDMLLHKIF